MCAFLGGVFVGINLFNMKKESVVTIELDSHVMYHSSVSGQSPIFSAKSCGLCDNYSGQCFPDLT